MKQLTQLTAIAALILVGSLSEAKIVHATDLDSSSWNRFFAGQISDWVVEFRQGDEIPVTFTAEGDFFETPQVNPTPLHIKKNFWLKFDSQKGIWASLDGSNFQPLPQVASGTFTVGANSDQSSGAANGITMNLKAMQVH